MKESMARVGDGPRRRRMIRGTIARIGELAMRYGQPSQLATLDCTSSRRSTVMCALPRATAVTTEYQRDSSSKRPRSSVVFAARALTRASSRCQKMTTASRASRPAGGAFGAPGPRAHPLTRRLLCRQADACRRATSLRRRVGAFSSIIQTNLSQAGKCSAMGAKEASTLGNWPC